MIKIRITNQAILDHFRITGGQFTRRQGLQHPRINQHQTRLIERTDHVLAAGMIDGCLAPHRGIHLGQQGGGHLYEVNAALVAGCREADHIADHPPPQCNQGGGARVTLAHQRIKDRFQGIQRLEFFAIRQNQRIALDICKLGDQPVQIEGSNGVVGDDHHLVAADLLRQREAVQQSLTNVYGVAALGKSHLKCAHRLSAIWLS